jgi:predicted amidohydrolase
MEAVTVALQSLLSHAREVGVALALGTCYVEPEDGRCYNQIRFYDREGTFQGYHSKILRCGTLTEPMQGEINHFAESPLRTFALEGVSVGGLICNDLWANPTCTPVADPHLTQQLSRFGATVVFHAVNGGRDGSELSRVAWEYHESNLRLRARAGKLWIVTVDNCHPIDIPCSAPSGVINPAGEWVVRTPPQGEQYFVTDVAYPKDP